MLTSRITIRIGAALQARLRATAETSGKTEAQIVREALEQYLARHESVVTCFDVFKRAGVIGCVKGGPSDLSTNPKYMEGFGRD